MTALFRVVARTSARALTGLLLAALLAAPRSALAAPDDGGADQHFRSGVQLYKENDFAAALVEFQRAYDVDPKYQVLFNIAETHYRLQDYAGALKAFQRYLDDGGKQIATKRRRDVEAEIVTLSQRVATVTITTSEPGAVVTIDDLNVGTTPLEPLVVSAGRRRITAVVTGRTPATKTVDIAGGDKQVIALDIPAAPVVREIKEPAPPPPPPAEGPSVVPMVVGWSVTGALTLGAVITGTLALGASSDLKDELARFPGDRGALDSAKGSAFGLGLATDILIGTSVAAAAVSTYFTVDFVLESEGVESEDVEPETTARLRVRPGGVSIDGTF